MLHAICVHPSAGYRAEAPSLLARQTIGPVATTATPVARRRDISAL